MPKFMVEVKYTSAGLQGVRKEGAGARIRAISTLAGQLGGSMESFYFSFGDVDAYVIVDLPDGAAVADWLTPVTAVVPGQLLAWRAAELRGIDVDHPGELSKVTLTR